MIDHLASLFKEEVGDDVDLPLGYLRTLFYNLMKHVKEQWSKAQPRWEVQGNPESIGDAQTRATQRADNHRDNSRANMRRQRVSKKVLQLPCIDSTIDRNIGGESSL